MSLLGFPSGTRGKETKRCTFDPWVGKILGKVGGGHGTPPQYSCLENPMDRGSWQVTVYGVARVGHDLTTTLLLLGSSAHEMLQARILECVAKPGGYYPWGHRE